MPVVTENDEKTTTIAAMADWHAQIIAEVERLTKDRDELIETLANSGYDRASWMNDAKFEFREGWGGHLSPEADPNCTTGHLCCDGVLVSRRVMELVAEFAAEHTGEFVFENECTVFRGDVEASQ